MAYFKFTKAAYENKAIDIYNHGDMERDFTYIDDITNGIFSAMRYNINKQKIHSHEIFNLGNSMPEKIYCLGSSHVTHGIVDYLSSFLGFENGLSAGMQTSWLSPFKEHRLTVTGSGGSLVFDDTKPWQEKLTLFQDQMQLNSEHFIINRANPIALPVQEAEPLKDEMRAFIQTCETGKRAPTDIAEAIMVQQVLETMQTHLIDTSAVPSNHQPLRPK